MILVTGATGHLGNVLVRQLIDRGESVRALILPGENLSSLSGAHVDVVVGDILDNNSLAVACKGVNTIFHLASLVSIEKGKEELLWRVNVDGTKNMIQAALNAGVDRFVYTSSIHAIERPPEGTPIDESHPFDSNNPAGPYDRTKAVASLEVLEAVKQGLNAVIVCPTGVIGPHDYKRSELGEMILDWMSPKVSFIIKGQFDFVDVRDIAEGHIAAAQSGRAGETYLLGGHQKSLLDFRKIVQEVMGKKTPAIEIPFPLAMMAAEIAATYYRMTKTRPTFTKYALETVTSNSLVSYEKATRELGYRPRGFAETISDTVMWWLKYQPDIKASLRT